MGAVVTNVLHDDGWSSLTTTLFSVGNLYIVVIELIVVRIVNILFIEILDTEEVHFTLGFMKFYMFFLQRRNK